MKTGLRHSSKKRLKKKEVAEPNSNRERGVSSIGEVKPKGSKKRPQKTNQKKKNKKKPPKKNPPNQNPRHPKRGKRLI